MFKLTAIILALVTANAVYVAATPVRYAEWDDSGERLAKRWPPLRPYYMPPAPFGYPLRPHVPFTTPPTPGETPTSSGPTTPTDTGRPIPSPTETESSSSRSTQVSFPTAVPQHSLRPLDSSKSTQSQDAVKTKNLAPTSTQVSQHTETQSSEFQHWPEPYNRPWGYIPPVRPWYPRPWYSRRRDETAGSGEEDYDESWVYEEGY
ncbi:hypothetical protein CCMSSC00406_0002940 [Pleurotus cornucopiae]|uniref:Uncharacterized protein n=1 Tax=Pleurotus cornucopiae TaxID=5321 RepID=A0ACB7J4P6_PLECO|nr:hypothetical protein CCMSSC00406_0002940 [Pleurotus cornucopiae]